MITDVNLNRLKVFTAFVRAGSFTAAAAPLGVTKAAVSQHIALLERELGVALVVRTTRRMVLTEAGMTFHADCVRILDEAEAAIARVSRHGETPSGTLRLTSTTDYGVAVLAPILAEFMRRYPLLRVDLVISDEILDLVGARFDLAIRVGWPRDSTLRTVRLASCKQVLVGEPRYLATHGTPATPQNLVDHAFIVGSMFTSARRITFADAAGTRQTVSVHQVAQVNNAAAMRELVLNRAGIAVLPDYLVLDDIRSGRLVRLLGLYALRDAGIYALSPAQKAPAKVKLFIESLRNRLAL